MLSHRAARCERDEVRGPTRIALVEAVPSDRIVRPLLRATIVVAAAALAVVPQGIAAARDVAPVDPHEVAASVALARLDVVDRAGQLVMTSVPGTSLDSRARGQLQRLRPGGVIVFADNHRSSAQLMRLLRTTQVAVRAGDASRPPAIVSIDQEGGLVKRIAAAPPNRSHPQLGAADRVGGTRAQAAATAAYLRPLGITMDLAPVADLDAPPARVMGARSFGRSPVRVSRHVAAFVRGLEQGAVAASVKHFPGFGSASVNSDDALATVGRTRTQLQADLQPFRAAIAAGASSVMVSHGVYGALDRRRPASASPIAYRMLREELGYTGVAITDSLHAAGFTAATGGRVAAGCVDVVSAGADIALLTGPLADALACRAQLVAAVRAGRLPRARLDEAVRRVLELKSRLGLLPAQDDAPVG
jgi:beta-N-acetylhexosaminidase